MPNGRVVIAGGTGFLGRAVAADLITEGYQVLILTRSPRDREGAIREVKWDGRSVEDWGALVDGARAVINLTGKSVNCRYTPANRREIIESRVDSVVALGEAIRAANQKPSVWIQSGSLAIYGDAGDRVCDEAAPIARGFSAETCVAWEKAFANAEAGHTRKVLFRIGFVIGRGGGALGTLAVLARRFLGGTVGTGRQFISWLHIADMNRMFRYAIEREGVSGTFNATGPNPVTNREFMRELRKALHRPWSPPAPALMVRFGARLMATEPELALTGRRCVPARLIEMGFEFQHPNLSEALADILAEDGR
jgi:uncharacterized protein (TIGR01777 family)